MANLQQFALPPRSLAMLMIAAMSLTACGGSDKIELGSNKNVNDAIEAATGPLQDLNLRRQEIPPLLVKAMIDPYAHSKKSKCADIKTEVAGLDEILGPDVEPKNITLASANEGLGDNLSNLSKAEIPDTESLADSAGGLAKDTLMNTIRSKTNILPFRSIIRSITGASRHQKKLAAAYEAGKLRRAYLKGYADVRFGDRCVLKDIVVEAKADIPPAK
ncbi:MAG: hypothetical protein ACOYNL_04990 [Rickettsiales bacterium]